MKLKCFTKLRLSLHDTFVDEINLFDFPSEVYCDLLVIKEQKNFEFLTFNHQRSFLKKPYKFSFPFPSSYESKTI